MFTKLKKVFSKNGGQKPNLTKTGVRLNVFR